VSNSPDGVVIGGGVIGLTIARRMAIDGLKITLLECGVCGGEASWAGAGVLSPANPHRQDSQARMLARSIELYPGFCRALFEESGVDPEYERCGEIQLAFDEQAVNILRADDRTGAAQALSLQDGTPAYRYYSSEGLVEVEPAVTREALGGLECRLAAQVRNPRLLSALRVACQRAGVEMREHTPARNFVVEGSRVVGVCTENETIHAGWVILCAGAWSSKIGDRLHEVIRVHPVRGQMVLMKLDARPFRRIISVGRTYLVPRRDGYVLLGSTEEPEAGFEKRTTSAGISHLTEHALRMVPMLADASIEATWSGLRPGTPDDRPYLGPVAGLEGLLAATGHYRNGLTLAPATAEAIAGFVAGRDAGI
jgi:glycine oxidase